MSGIITFKNAVDLQSCAKDIPLDRLIIETDSPYLAPTPHRGKRNEPSFVSHVAEFLSGLYVRDLEEIAQITTENAMRLFNFKVDVTY
jgi:TatD DNase family protein